tara:strand:- start:1006 stop:1692 length:687 start_codon:yes stop_codon:yes gene_type:complete
MSINNNLYNNNLIKKPWGQEYTIYKNRSKLAVTLVKIIPGKQTSLHCHPTKKTGFIIIKGKPTVQIGVHSDNKWKTKPLSILVLRPGLFHSISNPIKNRSAIYALEFETPYNKKDLVRFKDKYGRENIGYEKKNFMQKFDKDTLIFKNNNKKKIYKIFKRKVIIDTLHNKKQINKLKNKTVTAILDGKLINSEKKTVLSFGEIVKTKTLKILVKKFTIQNKLIILNVS